MLHGTVVQFTRCGLDASRWSGYTLTFVREPANGRNPIRNRLLGGGPRGLLWQVRRRFEFAQAVSVASSVAAHYVDPPSRATLYRSARLVWASIFPSAPP